MSKCNNCKLILDDEIRRYFWLTIPKGSYFEFTCPYCEKALMIEIKPIPEFIILNDNEAGEIII